MRMIGSRTFVWSVAGAYVRVAGIFSINGILEYPSWSKGTSLHLAGGQRTPRRRGTARPSHSEIFFQSIEIGCAESFSSHPTHSPPAAIEAQAGNARRHPAVFLIVRQSTALGERAKAV